MVQELQVLRCFSCETFQSQIVKKSNKWECKMCGVKQSVKKIYGRGSGKDCRIHAQNLNALRGKKEEIYGPHQDIKEADQTKPEQHTSANYCLFTSKASTTIKTPSKWVEFMDENETRVHQSDSDETEETSLVSKVVTYKSKAQKRKINYELSSENSNANFEDNFVVDEHICNTYFPSNTKKIKCNKNDVVEVDCCRNKNIVYDGYNQRLNRESALLCHSQNKRKSCGKWAEYLGKEDDVQMNKPSQNELKKLQNNCVESLTWDDCFEKDLKKDTTFIHSVNNHQLNKCINTSTNNIKYGESLGDKIHCNNFGKIPKNLFECDGNISLNSFERVYSPETYDFKVKSFDNKTREEGLTSNKLLKASLIHFDSSKKSVKGYEQKTSNGACYNTNKDRKHFIDLKHISHNSNIKNVNSSFSDLLKTDSKKYIDNEEVNLQEEKNINVGLPVFEQNGELSDSDFQLDF